MSKTPKRNYVAKYMPKVTKPKTHHPKNKDAPNHKSVFIDELYNDDTDTHKLPHRRVL